MKKQIRLAASPSLVIFGGFLFAAAFLRVHFRVNSTLLGYEIGKLKMQESALLEEKSYLNMQLSQLSSKRHLKTLAESSDFKEISKEKHALVSR